MKKRFSVIIAAYNREDYIRWTIDSVLSQTFSDYELIVVDDGSTDSTQEILQSYGTKITAIRQVNQGAEAAYMRGISTANGEYLAFLDHDDLFLPHTLATYDTIIRSLDSPPLVIGAMTSFTGQYLETDINGDNVIEVLQYRDYLAKDISLGVSQSRIVIKKAIFEKVYPSRKSTSPYIWMDYYLLLQSHIYGPCVITRRPITIAYRLHEGQITKNVDKMARALIYLIQMVRHGQCSGGYSRLLAKYAFLGGAVQEWSRNAFRGHRMDLASDIMLSGWPMLLAAVLKKVFLLCQPATKPLIITDRKPTRVEGGQFI